MASPTQPKFYADAQLAAVQFIYRRLGKAVKEQPQTREAALDLAIRELSGADPDLRRLKYFVPPFLRDILDPAEIARLEAAMSSGRRRAARLKMVYPLSADEFSLDAEFLASVLDFSGGPRVRPGGRFFTIGSCFAVNITQYLSANGHAAKTFTLAEDLNSPISNAFLFDILRRAPAERAGAMAAGLRTVFPQMSEADALRVADFKVETITRLAEELDEADCVVLTLGNVIDFFNDAADPAAPLIERVFPKYLAMSVEGDLKANDNAAGRLKTVGATLRMATHAEACEAIGGCIAGIRAITAAPIVVTLSPVPLDAAIGLGGTALRSAIEVDCVSKSRLRSAFEEITPALSAAYGPIHYFPSYEIVRWLAPMLNFATFGREDGAARHVSGAILDAVCSRFLADFVQWTDAAEMSQASDEIVHGDRI
jgi:hypothetical protein